MIATILALMANFLALQRVFLQVFNPCLMERNIPLLHNPAGTPGNIFSALLFFIELVCTGSDVHLPQAQ
jgi:hypothetical protein